jgi:hypothetical protein
MIQLEGSNSKQHARRRFASAPAAHVSSNRQGPQHTNFHVLLEYYHRVQRSEYICVDSSALYVRQCREKLNGLVVDIRA